MKLNKEQKDLLIQLLLDFKNSDNYDLGVHADVGEDLRALITFAEELKAKE